MEARCGFEMRALCAEVSEAVGIWVPALKSLCNVGVWAPWARAAVSLACVRQIPARTIPLQIIVLC